MNRATRKAPHALLRIHPPQNAPHALLRQEIKISNARHSYARFSFQPALPPPVFLTEFT